MNDGDCAAIILRHLQPLTEQLASLQARVDAAETSPKTRDAEYMRGAQMLVESTTTWQERAEAAEKQLTAAQEELAAERNLHGQTRVVVDELNTICNDLRNAGQPQFIRSEAIRLLREEVAALRAQLTALQSALAQKEKDGERLKKAQRWILNHCDRWEGDHACATCWPEAQRKHEPIITGFICAVCAANAERAIE